MASSPTVTVAEGKLQGGISESYDGQTVNFFLGIPFGKAPIGELRFKPPVAAESWTGIRDATKEGNKCIQRNLMTGVVEGNEDCLNLNVFTRELPTGGAKLKPVMVWIHGGAFLHGSNTTAIYSPDYLLTKDVVLVTINYRLGVLGFLNSKESLGVPGNLGLKDQLLALQWVQRNIRSFNGDPENVTIFGESAGGTSVHLHVVSPKSNGLFHKAIIQSPVILTTPPPETSLIEIVKYSGKEAKTEREALEVLKSLSYQQIFEAQENYLQSMKGLIFTPGAENDHSGNDPFYTALPLKMVSTGNFNKVPTIFGFNSNEGILFEVEQRLNKARGKEALMQKPTPDQFLPKELTSKVAPDVLEGIQKKIHEVYFTGENLKNPYLLPSDAVFNAGIIMATKLQAALSPNPVYLYLLDIDDDFNLFKKGGKCEDIPGMSHADELGYIFRNSLLPKIPKGSTAETAMRRLVGLWTNFATFGNPTPNKEELSVIWKPASREVVNYIEVGKDVKVDVDPIPERYKVWREIFQIVGGLK